MADWKRHHVIAETSSSCSNIRGGIKFSGPVLIYECFAVFFSPSPVFFFSLVLQFVVMMVKQCTVSKT